MLFFDLDKAYPDRNNVFSKWNHELWDNIAGYLRNYLENKNGTEFLNAYGYSFVNSRKSGLPHLKKEATHFKSPHISFFHSAFCDKGKGKRGL